MNELVIAFGLFLFIEGILYALFPAKMKNMLKKLDLLKDSQLRSGGVIFAVIGFVIVYLIKNAEKKISSHVQDIVLMFDTYHLISVDLSLSKNLDESSELKKVYK